MVAPKKRGGRAGPASKKAAAEPAKVESASEETQKEESELIESEEKQDESMQEDSTNNDTSATAETTEQKPPTEEAKPSETTETSTTETKAAEPVVEKIEPGKILVENLPSSLLFNYKEHLTELFSKYGEINTVKRGSISVTELTTTPTLSAIVEFKNKDSLEKALTENGTVIDNCKLSVSIEPNTQDTSVIVTLPMEVTHEYVQLLFSQCGEIVKVKDHNRGKYKTMLVIFNSKESVEKALKIDRELRINGYLVTVTKFKGDEENNSDKKNQQANNNANRTNTGNKNSPRGGFRGARGAGGSNYNNSPNYRGGRGGGGYGGGGGGNRNMYGGYNAASAWGLTGGYMGGYMNDGQRPNKRMRQM